MDKYAVIVAGGSGVRMGGSIPKQFLPLQGKPVVWHSITAFLSAFADLQIILVLPEAHIELGKTMLHDLPANRISITTGGDTRFQSVKNGLDLVKGEAVIFVHDGVRCLVTAALIHHCYRETI